MNNEELYEQAMDAITALFNDKSVSQDETKAGLYTLIGEIQVMISALE